MTLWVSAELPSSVANYLQLPPELTAVKSHFLAALPGQCITRNLWWRTGSFWLFPSLSWTSTFVRGNKHELLKNGHTLDDAAVSNCCKSSKPSLSAFSDLVTEQDEQFASGPRATDHTGMALAAPHPRFSVRVREQAFHCSYKPPVLWSCQPQSLLSDHRLWIFNREMWLPLISYSCCVSPSLGTPDEIILWEDAWPCWLLGILWSLRIFTWSVTCWTEFYPLGNTLAFNN